ncbi:MAG TPA: response regulator [Vicinamibacterales bacterium]|nr:response regulator [Vicinamibacterales bacterium]
MRTTRPILNVNDDDASRYVVTRILQAAGYEVVEAASGLEALSLVRAETPALVVLDIQLPDINGLEVCRRLKGDPQTAGIPVLQTSATFISADRKVQGLESGADGYLAQPIEPPELLATVRALLRANAAEQQVRDAASEWQQTFDALVEAVMVADRDGTVTRVNRAAMTMAKGVDLIGMDLRDAAVAMLGGSPVDWLAGARHSRARETTVLPVGNKWFEVSVDGVAEEAGGEPQRFVVVLSDVTAPRALIEHERRRARELADANEKKDHFVAMMAHELRNPLNAIATANSLGERLPADDDKQAWVRTTIARQASHLTRMVEDLLEASRLNRGRVQLMEQPLDLIRVIKQSVEASKPATDSRRQKVVTAIPPGPLMMLGDPLRLEQVLVNVINNASKYSEAGTTITVECDAVRDCAEVRVIDRGVGIPAEQLEAVFEPFVQVDQSLARTLGGIGMGLTLARGMVELHKGSIAAFSDGPSKGTTVVIRLPLSSQDVQQPEAAPESGAPGEALSILVIDDNKDAAEMLRSILETRQHSVRVAHDGPSGLDAATTLCPDVALIDIGLPGIDGYQIAASLRATSAGREMYLIAITGYGRPEDRARAIESGFDHYIVKPLNVDALDRQLASVQPRRHEARQS